VHGETDQGQGCRVPGKPPAALIAYWKAELPGLFPPGASWQALTGGRTNALWRVSGGERALVVKLYRAAAETPLFANDPDAEKASLAALAGTGLAPDLVAAAISPAGRSLVYRHVDGHPWTVEDDPEPVATALARLHAQPAPAALPRLPLGPARLRAKACDIAESLGAEGGRLAALMPGSDPASPPAQRAFLHGDATAANTLATSSGPVFIDWQCPACGDPADDLALFLSPAMQIVSGNPALTPAQVAQFLASYAETAQDGGETVARYRAFAPLYHARMAAYALWRAARGDAAYRPAAAAEIARLTEAG